MQKRGDGYDQLMSLWSIQEALLQAYRSIFITVESIVIAIAAAIAGTQFWSTMVLVALGVVLLYMWCQVTSNRAKDVSFVQWLLARCEEGEAVSTSLQTLKDFQGGVVITVGGRSVCRVPTSDSQGVVNDEPYVNLTQSPTRRWMEKRLPFCFGLLWVFVFGIAIYSK